MTRALILLITSIVSTTGFTQQFSASLDSLLNHYDDKGRFHGAIAVDTNGTAVYWKAIGYANIHDMQRARPNSRYAIGSITKTYIATLIMLRVEQGRLQLNTTIDKYFSELPHASSISIADLLRHNSGLTDANYTAWKYHDKQLTRIAKPQYANVNYGLLGEILEKVDNLSLQQTLQNDIFTPYRLEQTSYGISDSLRLQLATPYQSKGKKWVETPYADLTLAGGAGAIASTPQDVNRFFNLLFDHRIISEASLRLMGEMNSGYAMGLFPAQYFQLKGYTNSGQFSSYQSTVVHFPTKGFSICIVSNANGVSLNELLKEIMEICTRYGLV